MELTAPLFASALANLTEHVVQVRLDPGTHTMQFVAKGLPEWLACHLEDCRPRYTEALRFQAGLCIRCGDDAAKHPRLNPKMPAAWCATCYSRGAWENWVMGTPMKGGPTAHANRKTTRDADDALFDGIGDDDTEPVFAPDSLF